MGTAVCGVEPKGGQGKVYVIDKLLDVFTFYKELYSHWVKVP